MSSRPTWSTERVLEQSGPDIYEHKGNVLQAKQTLQSIIDHYEGEDLVTVARQKYAAIEAVELADRELEERERAERYRYAEEEEIVIPEM